MTVEHAYIGFGSNLGDRAASFARAVEEIRAAGYRSLRTAQLYSTEPWGGAQGGTYLNSVIEIECTGTPEACLKELLRIETLLGRKRTIGGAARTCDLDLLLWQDLIVYSDDLIVPHPRLSQRRFVLEPLCELIADAVHPKYGRTFAALLRECQDTSKVALFRES